MIFLVAVFAFGLMIGGFVSGNVGFGIIGLLAFLGTSIFGIVRIYLRRTENVQPESVKMPSEQIDELITFADKLKRILIFSFISLFLISCLFRVYLFKDRAYHIFVLITSIFVYFVISKAIEYSKGTIAKISTISMLTSLYCTYLFYSVCALQKDKTDIFSIFEKEFGRTLSPIEFEIIKAWLDGGFSTELIKEAIKEATMNNVSNLRYIDKILFEWGKLGIKTKEDVEKNRKKRNDSKNQQDENIDLDIIDYNWFDDDDE